MRLTIKKGIEKHRRGRILRPRYIRSFAITKKIGSVAYQLDLPYGLIGIHNVFHVSQLKKYNPDPNHVLNEETL